MQYIGFLAATLTTIAFIPQVWKIYKTKHTKDLSIYLLILLISGVTCWFIYGILLNDYPMIIANFFTLILNIYILYMKIRLDF